MIMANRVKRFIPIGLLLAVLLSLTGCEKREIDFNVSGYIQAVLDSNYKSENEEYIAFTNATEGEATANNSTTVSNAVARFVTKHKINASEEQKTELATVFQKAYSQCTYTVHEKLKTNSGYNVDVTYTPNTCFSQLSYQITNMITQADTAAFDVGAAYIDNIVKLCVNTVDSPNNGESTTKTIDIRLSSSGELSLNKRLLEQMDEELLPF